MDTTPLHCLLADPSFAACYDQCVSKRSRFPTFGCHAATGASVKTGKSAAHLKQQTDLPTVSLSHSQGFAALLCAPHPLTAGVDIEFIRPRDFKALSVLVCTQEEQDFLETANWPSETFYRLWCFKEALIKAANLDFPSDMKSVGYVFDSAQPVGLRAGKQTDWCGTSAILADTMALACVWKGKAVTLQWQFFGSLKPNDLTGRKLSNN